MSTPINHHYVSQSQIRGFFNEGLGKIFLYDKQLDNIFIKKTTKSVFSEDNLNSTVINGKVDHSAVEDDLRFFLEEKYTLNLNIIKNHQSNINQIDEQLMSALMDMIRLGSIGEMRHPLHKRHLDKQMEKVDDFVKDITDEILKAEIAQAIEDRKKVKYSNLIRYTTISSEILKLMGKINITLMYITSDDDYFLLPDCSSSTSRKHPDDSLVSNNPISLIFIPISSKIAIYAVANEYDSYPGSIKLLNNSLAVDLINRITLDNSVKFVACESKQYLTDFINKIKLG